MFVGSPSGSLGSSENVSGGSFGAPGGGLGVLKGVSGVSGIALWGFFGSLEAFRRGFWEAPQAFGRSSGGFLSAWYSRWCAPDCLPDSTRFYPLTMFGISLCSVLTYIVALARRGCDEKVKHMKTHTFPYAHTNCGFSINIGEFSIEPRRVDHC